MRWANLSGSTTSAAISRRAASSDDLPACGIDIDEVTQRLEDEGVGKFIKPFELLLLALRSRKSA